MNKSVIFNQNNYINPSYTHYGGMAGFQDYGCNGVKLKNNLINHWRESLASGDNIFEIQVPSIMPYEILKASGHVERFTDYVVYDCDGIAYRADHLVKDYYKEDPTINVDAMTIEDLEKIINEKKLINAAENVVISKKNLMFNMTDNTGSITFLRPELAQGIIINFNRYLTASNYQMPIGIASVDKSYRNEISTKHFTRLREFTQAELEYFIDPQSKSDPKILEGIDLNINIPTSTGIVTLQDLLSSKQVMSYIMLSFIHKVYIFAQTIGLKDNNIRFRKHEKNEMAHYAIECWDLECKINEDWLEVIGIADRGVWDCTVHSQGANKIVARRLLKEPRIVMNSLIELNKKEIARKYSKHMKYIIEYVEANNNTILANMSIDNLVFEIKLGKETLVITSNMFRIICVKKTETFDEYYPNIIEPSFGIDRLIYAILMQNTWTRADTENGIRYVLSLPIKLAPYNLALFVLLDREDLYEILNKIKNILKKKYSIYYDYSTTKIGKKYVRADSIGVPFAITIDVQSLSDQNITIRDRDTMQQVRIPINELEEKLKGMIGF